MVRLTTNFVAKTLRKKTTEKLSAANQIPTAHIHISYNRCESVDGHTVAPTRVRQRDINTQTAM